MPGVWVASVEIDGRFSCRTEDVSDACSRREAKAWLCSRLAQLGEPNAPIKEVDR